jgi:hypothetical protein
MKFSNSENQSINRRRNSILKGGLVAVIRRHQPVEPAQSLNAG